MSLSKLRHEHKYLMRVLTKFII